MGESLKNKWIIALLMLIVAGNCFGGFGDLELAADGNKIIWPDGTSGIVINEGKLSIVVGELPTGTLQEAISSFGYLSGQDHTVGFLSSFGYLSSQYNSGFLCASLGTEASKYNTGDNHSAFGSSAGARNEGDDNTAIGTFAFNAFNQDTSNEKDIDIVDPNNNQVVIYGGHGFGANNTFRNLVASTTDTLPTGISLFPELWQVVDPNTLVSISVSFTDVGVGTLTLTPQFIYENSTALGFNAEPDASNQVMLGDTNVTQVKTSGTLVTGAGRIRNTTRYTTTQVIPVTDDVSFCNTDGIAWTATLPIGIEGQTFRIINTGSSNNLLTISPNGAEDLLGANSNFLLFDGESLIVTYNATDGWY